MTRLGGAFWFVAVIASGATNFMVKQTVQNLDDELASIRRKTVAAQKEIHALSADWTFLNQPELLADLNKRHIGLAPMSPRQLVAIDSLPLRPVAPPAIEPPPQIAAVTPRAAPPVPSSLPDPPAAVVAIPLEPRLAAVAPPAAAAPTPAAPPGLPDANSAGAPPDPVVMLEPPPAAGPTPAAAPVLIVKAALAAPVRPAPAPQPASLDAVFAQIAVDR
jgi:cell division protein FtsL